eukprot:m.9940 g.9940  ORF g.9940 m.9940 type:complete len:804 (+) comp21767_c0_seq1:65-2476(+)
MSDDVFESNRSNSTSRRSGPERENWSVLDLAEKMRQALKTTPDALSVCSLIPYETRDFIVQCLHDESGDEEEKTKAMESSIRELESENLLLQAAFKQEADKRVSLQIYGKELVAELESMKRVRQSSEPLAAESAASCGNDDDQTAIKENPHADLDHVRKPVGDASNLGEQVDVLKNTISQQELKIAELKATVQKYKRVQDMVRSASLSVGRRPGDVTSPPQTPSGCDNRAVDGNNTIPLAASALPSPGGGSLPSTGTQWQFGEPKAAEQRVRRASMDEKVGSSQDIASTKKKKRFGSFTKGKLFKLGKSRRSSSEPNLSSSDETDARDDFTVSAEAPVPTSNSSTSSNSAASRLRRSASAIRGTLGRAIGRLRRHTSQTAVNDLDGDDEYQDGRPGWTVARSLEHQRDLGSHPLAGWGCDAVASWMSEIGLDIYSNRVKTSGFTGMKLIKSTEIDLDKDLVMYHPLHKKKLKLAFNNLVSESKDSMDKLGHAWIASWLDGIGLPQYKNNFFEARIDGRVLNVLTMEDLAFLKVQNAFHHVSFKRAIQCLRQQNFNPAGLVDSDLEGVSQSSHGHKPPEHVIRWTNARVCKWLESIEMAEYAGNLKESGINGALMVLEPRFNADTLAALLQVKELIRRHLSQHFSRLVGPAFLASKREAESTKGFVPLEPHGKKPRRRIMSLGSLRRRTKADSDMRNAFVCPVDLDMPLTAVTGHVATLKESGQSYYGNIRAGTASSQGGRREQRRLKEESKGSPRTVPSSGKRVEVDGRGNEIEVMSNEMDSLTDMINKELEKKKAMSEKVED